MLPLGGNEVLGVRICNCLEGEVDGVSGMSIDIEVLVEKVDDWVRGSEVVHEDVADVFDGCLGV